MGFRFCGWHSGTEAHREQFERDGVVCVRGLLAPHWIERLRDAIAGVMATPSEFSRDLAVESGDAGSFYQEINVSLRREMVRRFIFQSPVVAAAATILKSDRVRFFSDQLLVKEPGASTETLWHQDYPYFPCDGNQICSVWLGLDPVTRENGVMSFVLGSHRMGRLYAPQNFGSGGAYDSDPFDGPPPDIDANPEAYQVSATKWNQATSQFTTPAHFTGPRGTPRREFGAGAIRSGWRAMTSSGGSGDKCRGALKSSKMARRYADRVIPSCGPRTTLLTCRTDQRALDD